MNTRSDLSLLLLTACLLLGVPLRAQGQWNVSFDHVPNGPEVHPSSDSITNPSQWFTLNPPVGLPGYPPPHLGMNTVHVCLIPSGVHRGEVLVWDGNLTNLGTRAFQPWSIVNPYWPAPNPNFWPGQAGTQYRFHNGLIALTTGPNGQGELFCAGQCWMPDGRLLVAGGTKRYPIQTGDWFEGARHVWQWDHKPVLPAHPFGRWFQMADLEVDRWYPTVTYDGTTGTPGTPGTPGAIVIGGTNWTSTNLTQPVNSYELVRIAFDAQPIPALLPQPNSFDQKPSVTQPGVASVPAWPAPHITPPPSRRQYWGQILPFPFPRPAAFDDYPRVHVLGILDSIPSGGTSPRLFVSGFHGWGMRWAHDASRDPSTFALPPGVGLDIGQFPANNDARVQYATSLLLPGAINGKSTTVARIGGDRTNVGPSNVVELVETVNVTTPPGSSWQTIPTMNYHRHYGNVVILPTGDLFAIGGKSAGGFNLIPELFDGTSWKDMAPHLGAREYHSAAILLPDARVLLCGGEGHKPAPDYMIWEPPYFHLDYGSVPPMGIRVDDEATGLKVEQDRIGPLGLHYAHQYRASWTNTLEPGIEVSSVVLMRPEALTHHDDGGQRMVRLKAGDDGLVPVGFTGSIVFSSPQDALHAPPGWWMLFLVNSAGRPSQAYWVHLM